MGSVPTVVSAPGGAVLATLSRNTVIAEVAVAVIVIGLLVAILVLTRRKNSQAKAASQPAATQGYYADVPEAAAAPGTAAVAGGGQPDPFAGFGAAPAAAPPAAAPAPQTAPLAAPAVGVPANGIPANGVPANGVPSNGNPPPGTPAGWLPEPSGAPDTLRYWDGAAWTQHVAQRT